MKTYTIPNLKKLSKEQGYKMAALENEQGERIVPYNQIAKVNIEKQFDTIVTRLKSELHPDGVYFVCLAHNINKSKNPDKYAITKGKIDPDALAEAERRSMPITPVIIEKQESVLSWDGALAMQQKISDLTTENARLKYELDKALEELDNIPEPSELSEGGKQNDLVSFLKETIPSLMPLVDRGFDLAERRLNLQELKIQASKNSGTKQGTEKKIIIPGTQEHLNLIEFYFNKNNEERLNAELDKLEEANPELYKQVIAKLGMSEEGEDNGE